MSESSLVPVLVVSFGFIPLGTRDLAISIPKFTELPNWRTKKREERKREARQAAIFIRWLVGVSGVGSSALENRIPEDLRHVGKFVRVLTA
jgi:hypothetical protein